MLIAASIVPYAVMSISQEQKKPELQHTIKVGQKVATAKATPLDTLKAYNGISFRGENEKMNVDFSRLKAVDPNYQEIFTLNKGNITKAINRLNEDKNKDGQWLKWIDLPQEELKKADEIQTFVDTNVKDKFDDVVLLGIGGSSLGAKTLMGALTNSEWNSMSKEERKGYPKMHVLENIDPDHFSEVVDRLDLKKTLVLVVSKSGKTPETSATFLNMQERLKNTVGAENLKDHIVAITDKNPASSVLKAECDATGIKTFVVPDDVGGRYSVMSDVGIVPAAMMGVDIKSLLKGAADASKEYLSTENLDSNLAAKQAIVHKHFYDKGKAYQVIMPYSDKLALTSDWFAQLWAESLGKAQKADGTVVHANYTPIRAIGAVNQHSELQAWREGAKDKVFTMVTVKEFNNSLPITKDPANVPEALAYMKRNTVGELINEEAKATMQVLSNVDKHPVVNIELPKVDAYNIGKMLQTFMIETALVGELEGLHINTFLQPAVEEGKVITKKSMADLSEQKAK